MPALKEVSEQFLLKVSAHELNKSSQKIQVRFQGRKKDDSPRISSNIAAPESNVSVIWSGFGRRGPRDDYVIRAVVGRRSSGARPDTDDTLSRPAAMIRPHVTSD